LPTYTCLIVDDRYSVPSLTFHAAASEVEARAYAQADLDANPHHKAIEVRDGDEILFVARRKRPA
jgi:hypothetical protein